jgi:hypothetical protein
MNYRIQTCLCSCKSILRNIHRMAGTFYQFGKIILTTKNNSILLWLYSPLLGFGRLFSFLIYIQSVGLLVQGISPSQGLYLHTEEYKQNKLTQTSMPRVGFELTTPVFERGKTVHALDRAATVIGATKNNISCKYESS